MRGVVMTHHPYIVDVIETVPSWPTGTYELKGFGFGETTLGRAIARAEDACTHFTTRRGQPHRFEIHYFCTRCRGYGIVGRLPYVPILSEDETDMAILVGFADGRY
jgi:hypothetical protein